MKFKNIKIEEAIFYRRNFFRRVTHVFEWGFAKRKIIEKLQKLFIILEVFFEFRPRISLPMFLVFFMKNKWNSFMVNYPEMGVNNLYHLILHVGIFTFLHVNFYTLLRICFTNKSSHLEIHTIVSKLRKNLFSYKNICFFSYWK